MPDDFDSVVADRCSAVDEVPVPADLWSRVQFKVLDRIPVQFTEEEATMIDLETPSQTEDRRKGPKRLVAAGLLAAAAVAAIAIVAIRNDDPVSPAEQTSPTVTAPATVPPRALFGTPDEQFVPGTYYLDEVSGVPTPRIFITLGDDWENTGDGFVIAGMPGVIGFSRPDNVWNDACHATEGFQPGPWTTVDGLVTALYEQRGWVDVSAPSDATVNGYAGKEFQRAVPADLTDCEPLDNAIRSFDGYGGGSSHYEPGEIETVRVLDVNGTIILINTRLQPGEHFDAAAAAELGATLDSIRIEQT
jgi:hypothetical protein